MIILDILKYPFMQATMTTAEKKAKVTELENAGNYEQADKMRSQQVVHTFNFARGVCIILVFFAFLPITLPWVLITIVLPAMIKNWHLFKSDR